VLIIFREREKSILLNTRGRLWLRCEISKQLGTVIDASITISIERQPRIVAAASRPSELFK